MVNFVLLGCLLLALAGLGCLFFCKGPERRRLAWAAAVFVGALALFMGGNILLGFFQMTWRTLPSVVFCWTLLVSGWIGILLTLGCLLPQEWPNLAPVLRCAVKGGTLFFAVVVLSVALFFGPLAIGFGFDNTERVVEYQGQTLLEVDEGFMDPWYSYYAYHGPLVRGTERIDGGKTHIYGDFDRPSTAGNHEAVTPEIPETVTPETPEAVTPETPEAVPPEVPEAVPPETPEAVPPEAPEAVTPEIPEAVAPEVPETVFDLDSFYQNPIVQPYADIRTLGESYDNWQARMDMCFVVNAMVFNETLYYEFMEQYQKKEDAFIRVVQGTGENDIWIDDILYDSGAEKIYLVHDAARNGRVAETDRKITIHEFDGIAEYRYSGNGRLYWIAFNGNIDDVDFDGDEVFVITLIG